jgi:hypothetical protein
MEILHTKIVMAQFGQLFSLLNFTAKFYESKFKGVIAFFKEKLLSDKLHSNLGTMVFKKVQLKLIVSL